MPERIGAADGKLQSDRPGTALRNIVVPAVAERAIIRAEIPTPAPGKITSISVVIADAMHVAAGSLKRRIMMYANRGTVDVAIAAVAGRITMNVDASMRVATRGRASRARRTNCFNSGEPDQQKRSQMYCGRSMHAGIPEPSQPSPREGPVAGRGYKMRSGKLMACGPRKFRKYARPERHGNLGGLGRGCPTVPAHLRQPRPQPSPWTPYIISAAGAAFFARFVFRLAGFFAALRPVVFLAAPRAPALRTVRFAFAFVAFFRFVFFAVTGM